MFLCNEINFLSHVVNATGICQMPTQMTAIQNFPHSTVIKELQAFEEIIDFYHRSVSAAAELFHTIKSALVGCPTRTSLVKWSTSMDKTFCDAKTTLTSTILVHPCQDAPIAVTLDASDLAVGGKHPQAIHTLPLMTTFFHQPQALASPDQLAHSIENYSLPMLLSSTSGISWKDVSVHSLLITSHSRFPSVRSDTWSAWQQYQPSVISNYTMDIRHVAGKGQCARRCFFLWNHFGHLWWH